MMQSINYHASFVSCKASFHYSADRGMCFEHGEKVRNNCSFYHYTSTFCSFKHAKRTIELTADNYTLAEIARDSCPITVERKRYFYNQCTYE